MHSGEVIYTAGGQRIYKGILNFNNTKFKGKTGKIGGI